MSDPRQQYKRYLKDPSVEVPRSTRHRISKSVPSNDNEVEEKNFSVRQRTVGDETLSMKIDQV